MLNKNLNTFFKQWTSLLGLLVLLIFGISLSMFSKNMFVIWVGLELKMFGVIPLLKFRVEKKVTFISAGQMKVTFFYFFVQVMGSLFFAWGTVLSEYYMLAVMGLLLKIGASPLFWWVPPLMSRLDWFSMGLLSTMQKIPGLVLFRMIYDLKVEMSMFLSFLGFFMASVGIKVSFKNLKNLLGWSSVSNMSILFLIFVLKSSMGILYYLFYSVLVLMFCLGMSFMDSNILCKNFLKGQKLKTKFFMSFILLVFSGLPPFISFLLKVYFFSSFYLLDSCYMLVELDLKGNFLSYFYLLGSFLQSWKMILIFMFLIMLQSVGYMKAFMNVKVKSLSRSCSAASYIKKSMFFLLLLFLLVYLLSVSFMWF